jgi:hypothetical protein
MSGMNNRLRRLEERASAQASGPCPECGDNPPHPELVAVYADDTPDELRFYPDRERPEGEPFCPACGREQYVILEIHYDR